jgi:RNA polymerase sigma-70 factor (ECF subfamily)
MVESHTSSPGTDWSQLDDHVLVKAHVSGDKAAFEVLFRKYRDVVHRLVFSIVRDETLAQDVVQEVFLLVYRHLHKFRQDSAFKTWVYRIGVNEAIRHLSRLKRWQPLSDTEIESASTTTLVVSTVGNSPERILMEKEQRERVGQAIAGMKAQQRLILNLYYLEELPVQEIARILDIPEGSVKSRLFYAREDLKKVLEPIFHKDIAETRVRHVVA